MKKILLLIGIAAFFASCGNSPESKANALIEKELRKQLYKPDTYNPIETSIDSAFSPKDDPVIIEKMKELIPLGEDFEKYQNDVKHAKSSMAIWEGPYQSSFGRNNYEEAKSDYDQASANLEKATAKVQKLLLELDSLLNKKPKFVGWKATHNYRADNNIGSTLIGNSVYIIDENFEKILFSCEEEVYKEYQKGLELLKEQINEQKQETGKQ